MKPGTTLLDVQRDFDRINAELLATYPADYGIAGTPTEDAGRSRALASIT